MLKVFAVYAGHKYPREYVHRLQRMVSRNLSVPHQFCLLTDQVEQFRQCDAILPIALKPCKEGGFFNKVQLFDVSQTGREPFLYLDITLLILSSIDCLVDFGSKSQSSIVAVSDWNYPVMNSCVLWVNPDEKTGVVWDSWQKGERFGMSFSGDQNYIDHVMRMQPEGTVDYWPEGSIASYKALRKLAISDEQAARVLLDQAQVLKFHGNPKPTGVLNPLSQPWSTIFRHPLKPRVWRFLHKEIREIWMAK